MDYPSDKSQHCFKQLGMVLFLVVLATTVDVRSISAQVVYFEDRSSVARLATAGKANGVAVHDYDNDGWEDIYFAVSRGTSALFRNQGDGTFIDVSAAAGVDVTGSYSVPLWGDVDNDGNADLFVGSRSGGDNRLFKNNGDGTFTDLQNNSGLDPLAILASAAFADVNNDGAIDLFYAVDRGPDQLYLNTNGLEPFLFDDISEIAGIGGIDLSVAMQSSWIDYDNDCDVDLFSVHDSRTPSRLYRNEGFLPLINVASSARIDLYPNEYVCCNMGVAWGDYNRDGWLDAYVTRIGHGGLYRNEGDGTFTDVAAETGAARNGMSWGVVFADFDNDADLDLFIVSTSGYDGTPTLLYRNDDGYFSEIGDVAGAAFHLESQGLAKGDFNNDGLEDLVIARHDGQNMLLMNASAAAGNWVKIRLEGRTVNRMAIGTRIEVVADGKTLLQYVSGGDSFASQSSSFLHVGLGSATHIDTLRIHWSPENTQELTQLQVNSSYVIVEEISATSIDVAGVPASGFSLDGNFPNPFYVSTKISYRTSKTGRISLDVYDLHGKYVVNLEDSVRPPGSYAQEFDGVNLPAGVYFYRLRFEGMSVAKKMVLVK